MLVQGRLPCLQEYLVCREKSSAPCRGRFVCILYCLPLSPCGFGLVGIRGEVMRGRLALVWFGFS